MNDYESSRRPEDNRAPEEIENDLERTRAQMSSTIDAIQHKLTPGEMMDQAFAYAKNSLPADFGVNLGNAVRDNPVPTALIGLGVAWLMMSGRNSDGRARLRRESMRDSVRYTRDPVTEYDLYETSGSGDVDSSGNKIKRAASKVTDAAHGVMDKASELGHKISDTASSMTGRARDMTNGARDRMQGTTESAKARAGELTQRSQQQYYRAKDSVSHMIDEQPLLIGALGIAIGTILGAALPATRREDELMGRTRDDLLDRAKETAKGQAESVKESVKRVAQTAKEETQRVASEASHAISETNGQSARPGVTGKEDGARQEGMQGPHGYH